MQGRVFIAIVASLFSSVWCAAAELTILPDLYGGGPLRALKIMPDGQGVIGISHDSKIFRWTPTEGHVIVAQLPTTIDGLNVLPTSMSSDGSAVLMHARGGPFGYQAYRWSQEQGLIHLGHPVDFEYGMSAFDVSRDGSVVVGVSRNQTETVVVDGQRIYTVFDWKPFRWTEQTGFTTLADLTWASAVSDDGATVLGMRTLPDDRSEAVRWSETSGVVGLGDLPDGALPQFPAFLSSDGQVIVGNHESSTDDSLYRWTGSGGITSLERLGDGLNALAVSGNGSVALARVYDTIPFQFGTYSVDEPAIWDQVHGTRRLRDVLAAQGVNLGSRETGYRHEAMGISFDGTTILGWTEVTTQDTFPPASRSYHWIARLSVPEPYGLSEACIILAALCGSRKRRRLEV